MDALQVAIIFRIVVNRKRLNNNVIMIGVKRKVILACITKNVNAGEIIISIRTGIIKRLS